MTIRRHLPPAEGRRLLRDAGPPTRWVIAAFLLGTPVITLAAATSGASRLGFTILWLGVLAVPSLLDRDGQRIRIGMAWLAAEQRRRMPGALKLPRTPAGADRWLEQPGARDAGLMQASALLTAGRTDEARRLVESYAVENAEDRARVARLLAAIDGLEQGRVDATAANAAIDALPAEAQRYHRLSLAWSTAWVEAANRRPWRRAFANASAGLRPAGIPVRLLAYGAFQWLLAPVIGLALILILLAAGWL